VVIVMCDQVVFRPLVAWADRFRFEQTASQVRPTSWLYDLVRRARLLRRLFALLAWPVRAVSAIDWPRLPRAPRITSGRTTARMFDELWLVAVAVGCAWALWVLAHFIARSLTWGDVLTAFELGLATMARVAILIPITSLIWVPIGVWIGLRPASAVRVQALAQFLAAFPANLLFPFAVPVILAFRLDPDIWLSPLMILGAQWYILFNAIAGASAIPTDIREAAAIFGIRGWQWWRQVGLPGIFPYYVTGALTAAGGAWNASIVAEAAYWGDRHIAAHGLGSFIADATAAGDYPRVVLGIAVMSVFVIALNRALWRPMYRFAERRLRFD